MKRSCPKTHRTVQPKTDCTVFSNASDYTEPAFLSQVGLFLTFHCTIRCRHCMVCAGPDRTEEIDLDEATDWIGQIVAYQDGLIKSVGFTGGEPFCVRDKLFHLAATARRAKLWVAVMTNGFWADSKQKALDWLDELKPSDMSVSTDVYHAEYIPLKNVEAIFQASEQLGIRCDITLTYAPEIMKQTENLIQQICSFAPAESIRTTRVFPSGRGQSQDDFQLETGANNPPSNVPCLFATVPYILPDGGVLPCVGPVINVPRQNNPLFLGSLREQTLAEIFDDSRQNPILQGLRIWGPRFWHKLIEKSGPKAVLPAGYYTDCPCEGCIALLKKPAIAKFLSEACTSQPLRSQIQNARQTLLQESTS